MSKLQPENWQSKKKILVILAHPDDPEFFCGATLARWAAAGHEIAYLLLTKGDKGSDDPAIEPARLMAIRTAEQLAAARTLGVNKVDFFDYPDGYLEPDLEMRRKIVRSIRKERPEIIVTSDPLNYYIRGKHINHPDHRAAGQVTLDAVFPAAGNRFFFPELLDEGLLPFSPEEIWISLTHEASVVLDVTEYWQTKINALICHASQIGEAQAFRIAMLERRTADSQPEHPRYEEGFRRLFKR